MEPKTPWQLRKKLQVLNDVLKIQCSNGNWNYNDYMRGMANGLILANSIFNDEEPNYLDKPEVWLEDLKYLGATDALEEDENS